MRPKAIAVRRYQATRWWNQRAFSTERVARRRRDGLLMGKTAWPALRLRLFAWLTASR
jgi:hypothetical protein